MEFVLWEKLAGLEGKELVMLIAAAVVAAALIVLLVCLRKRSAEEAPGKRVDTRALVYGALCISLSFVLSYIKLFSMPMGGSLTLCSMLPIAMYAWAFGPAYGLHRRICIQPFADYPGRLDCASRAVRAGYFIAFTCYGLSSLFPKCLPLGVGVAGLARYACSVISGVVFFADSAAEAGYESALLYSLGYNGGTIGVETILCVIVACVPGVVRIAKAMNRKRA